MVGNCNTITLYALLGIGKLIPGGGKKNLERIFFRFFFVLCVVCLEDGRRKIFKEFFFQRASNELREKLVREIVEAVQLNGSERLGQLNLNFENSK